VTSTYNHSIALQIYSAIATAGEEGLDLEQLQARIPSPKKKDQGMALNTLRTYCRWLEKDGAIEIYVYNSEAHNRPLKNFYVAVREPSQHTTDRERLKMIEQALEPFSRHPKSWDKAYKGEIIHAVQEAVRLCGLRV